MTREDLETYVLLKKVSAAFDLVRAIPATDETVKDRAKAIQALSNLEEVFSAKLNKSAKTMTIYDPLIDVA